MYQQIIKSRAIELRKQGYSYSYISKAISVPKPTLSEWLCKVPYSPNEHTIGVIGKARAASGVRKGEIKRATLENARLQALKDIGEISKRDLFMLGLGVYIGEGAKSYNITRIVNANPEIIRLSIRWFREACGIGLGNLKIRLHLYPDNNPEECLNFWSKQTSVPKSQFYKPIVDIRANKKMAKGGKLPYGTAHLLVVKLDNEKLGVKLHRLILAWMERVLC
jgi:hypothetical protein